MKFYNEVRLNYFLNLLVLPSLELEYSALYNEFKLVINGDEEIKLSLSQNEITFRYLEKEVVITSNMNKDTDSNLGVSTIQSLVGSSYKYDTSKPKQVMLDNALKYLYVMTTNLISENKDFKIKQSILHVKGDTMVRVPKPIIYYDGDSKITTALWEDLNSNLVLKLFNNELYEETNYTPNEYNLLEQRIKNLGRI